MHFHYDQTTPPPSEMDRWTMQNLAFRNFVLFSITLVTCACFLIYSLLAGNIARDTIEAQTRHTYQIIIEAQRVAALIEKMQGAQRGYLLTQDKSFMDEYTIEKGLTSDYLAKLAELTADNKSQQSRLDEMRQYFADFSHELDARVDRYVRSTNHSFLKDITLLSRIKDNLTRVNNAILEEEYELLRMRVDAVEQKKNQYFLSLLIGIASGSILLMMFNWFLLRSQRKRHRVEASLIESEQRFALAVDGSQDAIFDWDIKNNTIFFSRRYYDMLGLDTKMHFTTVDAARERLHPDDTARTIDYLNRYLAGNLSEYVQEFRMRHQSGRWIWVQSRAKALFNRNGIAYRMVGSHTDITHMKQTQERMRAEKEKAEKASQAKSDFLAHMSHEIRTPLTAITGIAEILQRKQDGFDGKQRQLVKTLSSSATVLKDLITDILDFSKIESGELELDQHDFMFEEVFEDIVSMMSLRAGEKHLNFLFDYTDIKGLSFYGDKARLRQILVNLIGNAIKFTEQGGVTVKTMLEDKEGTNCVRIEVADNGIGIAPEDFDMIFERFKQVGSEKSRQFGGTGLGLLISRNLARLMGGDIFVTSQLGHGSTFTVILPLLQSIVPRSEHKSPDLAHKISDRITATVHGETRILLVEDYEGNITILSYLLEELGVAYDVARTGLEALELWQRHHYDVVLMDVQMPEMDGFTATREIRRLEAEQRLNRTPIIGITAHALIEDKDECIDAGMDSYLPKPIVENDLKREILKYLAEPRQGQAA